MYIGVILSKHSLKLHIQRNILALNHENKGHKMCTHGTSFQHAAYYTFSFSNTTALRDLVSGTFGPNDILDDQRYM